MIVLCVFSCSSQSCNWQGPITYLTHCIHFAMKPSCKFAKKRAFKYRAYLRSRLCKPRQGRKEALRVLEYGCFDYWNLEEGCGIVGVPEHWDAAQSRPQSRPEYYGKEVGSRSALPPIVIIDDRNPFLSPFIAGQVIDVSDDEQPYIPQFPIDDSIDCLHGSSLPSLLPDVPFWYLSMINRHYSGNIPQSLVAQLLDDPGTLIDIGLPGCGQHPSRTSAPDLIVLDDDTVDYPIVDAVGIHLPIREAVTGTPVGGRPYNNDAFTAWWLQD